MLNSSFYSVYSTFTLHTAVFKKQFLDLEFFLLFCKQKCMLMIFPGTQSVRQTGGRKTDRMKLSCIQTKKGTQHAGYSRGRKTQLLRNEGLLMLDMSFWAPCHTWWEYLKETQGQRMETDRVQAWTQQNPHLTKTSSSDQLSSCRFSKSTLLPPKI